MNRYAKLALVALVTGLSLGHGASPPSASAASAPNTGPMIVNNHDYPLEYARTMTRCYGGDRSWQRYERCAQLHPDTGERCLRVEEWVLVDPARREAGDRLNRVLSNTCGY